MAVMAGQYPVHIYGSSHAPPRNQEARLEIIHLQVRHLVENLCDVETRGEKIEHIHDANPHPADARATSALLRVDGDAF